MADLQQTVVLSSALSIIIISCMYVNYLFSSQVLLLAEDNERRGELQVSLC